MDSRLPVIDDTGEVSDLSHAAPELFRPFSELPATLQEKIRRRRPTQRVTLHLSPEVVATFKATGKGWQARVDAALKEWIAQHRPAATGHAPASGQP